MDATPIKTFTELRLMTGAERKAYARQCDRSELQGMVEFVQRAGRYLYHDGVQTSWGYIFCWHIKAQHPAHGWFFFCIREPTSWLWPNAGRSARWLCIMRRPGQGFAASTYLEEACRKTLWKTARSTLRSAILDAIEAGL